MNAPPKNGPPLKIAVVGTGISGLSAAWLLSERHDVTVYERDVRIGGHTCTVAVPGPGGASTPVDMGFIVYNEATYPNLAALFRTLGVETRPTCMSLGISMDDGALEYGSRGLAGILAQPGNMANPRFLRMLADLVRFYLRAPVDIARAEPGLSLGDYLDRAGYSEAFQADHLLPQAAAIWSSPVARMRDYPAEAFVRFFDNHGLLKLINRPHWRTVVGGSSAYIAGLTARYRDRIRVGCGARSVRRDPEGAVVTDENGNAQRYDRLVLAVHTDQALRLLEDPTPRERAVLGDIRYGPNEAVLHTDASLMPRRRAVWSSWNYVGRRADQDAATAPSVSYWMNQLQGLDGPELFVTLNPSRQPTPETVLERRSFDHPLFDAAAMAAQSRLWSLQGVRDTWFCGAYFGAGFHEDGLQAGLAVAEALGGVRRPWTVAEESGRIALPRGQAWRPLAEATA